MKAKLQKVTPKKKSNVATQLSIFEVHDDKLRSKLLEIDINSITPIQAMQHLEDLQKDAK